MRKDTIIYDIHDVIMNDEIYFVWLLWTFDFHYMYVRCFMPCLGKVPNGDRKFIIMFIVKTYGLSKILDLFFELHEMSELEENGKTLFLVILGDFSLHLQI